MSEDVLTKSLKLIEAASRMMRDFSHAKLEEILREWHPTGIVKEIFGADVANRLGNLRDAEKAIALLICFNLLEHPLSHYEYKLWEGTVDLIETRIRKEPVVFIRAVAKHHDSDFIRSVFSPFIIKTAQSLAEALG